MLCCLSVMHGVFIDQESIDLSAALSFEFSTDSYTIFLSCLFIRVMFYSELLISVICLSFVVTSKSRVPHYHPNFAHEFSNNTESPRKQSFVVKQIRIIK
jgi:hypothetical protein